MELIALKVFAKQAWSAVKLHWKLIPIGLGIVFAFFFVRNKQQTIAALLQSATTASQEHNTNIAQLQTQLQQEIQRRTEIQKHYDDMIAQIQVQHNEEALAISERYETEIKALISQYKDNPEAMAQVINTRFAIPLVKFTVIPQVASP